MSEFLLEVADSAGRGISMCKSCGGCLFERRWLAAQLRGVEISMAALKAGAEVDRLK